MPENYHNVKILLDILGTDYFSFVIGDNKILRICYGMQSCSAKHSCTWCIGSKPFDEEYYELRTFEHLLENYNGYQDQVAKVGETNAKLRAMDFFNVVNKSLLKGTGQLLDRSPPGQLHCFLGVGNKVFDWMYKMMIEDIDNKFHKEGIQNSIFEIILHLL